MSRRDDLAYGDIPQRWDRDRFERFGRGPPPPRFEEEYRFTERDRPGRRDIAVADRIEERGPRGRFEERDRFWEEERRAPSRPRRRTDRELFGDVDPRELAGMALTPYRRKSISREELDIDRRDYSRPGPLVRRQSSLDTFDRRPSYVEREEFRVPPYTPVPLPVRSSRYREEWYEPEDYREVEIRRERSFRRGGRPKSVKPESEKAESVAASTRKSAAPSTHKSVRSKAKSKVTSHAPSHITSSSSSSESFVEEEEEEDFQESVKESIQDSIVDTQKQFRKGKTRMPKRLVRREAILDLAYPFDEEDDFFVLRCALDKDQIDEVIRVSEQYKNGEKEKEKEVFRFEEKVEEAPAAPSPPRGEREEITRTEWLNPPSVVSGRTGGHERSRSRHTHRTSHSHHHSQSRAHSRAPSSPANFVEERRTIIESASPPPPPPSAPPAPGPPPAEFYEDRRTIIEERVPASSHHSHHTHHSPSHHGHGTLVVQERESRSDRDIQSEIRALEAERRALRLEREAEEKREKALRLREHREEDYQLVEYREARPALEVYERERSPPRNVLRVEKDRKDRKPNAKAVAFAMATLT